MCESKKIINQISTFFLDMDGVLYTGDTPINGAAETITYLRRRGKKIVFMTNNSMHTRRAYVRKLARIGIPASESKIITSAYATRLYLLKRAPRARVYVVGGQGLKEELAQGGFRILSDSRASDADFVVAGLDRAINYKKLTAGVRALLAGAEFIATNTDAVYPTGDGISPGAGAIIGALSVSSGKQPKVVIGKPSLNMVKLALEIVRSKPSETAIVGDKLSTDVQVGKRAGFKTILVLSGVTSRRDFEKIKNRKEMPDAVIPSIKNLMVSK